MAIQLLRQLSATRVIALDMGEDKLAFAKEVEAHEAFESGPEAGHDRTAAAGWRGSGHRVMLSTSIR